MFIGEDNGQRTRQLFFEACEREGVDVVGSTPYVEPTVLLAKKNIEWIVDIGNPAFRVPFAFCHLWVCRMFWNASDF